MQLNDVTALVTGGASGLGLATSQRLIAGGARVVVIDLGRATAQEAVAALGNRAVLVPGDVTNEDDVARALDIAAELSSPLRVVVNCAGIGPAARVLGRGGPHPLDDFTKVITINLIGTFNVIRLAAERMATIEPDGEERGVIVNTASVAAFDGQIGQAAYAASKAGISGMTLPVARDLAQHLIRVVTIAPGLFQTPMLAALPQEAQDSLGQQVPHPSRLGSPDEYAALVEHIISNPMLNGETIRLDGAIRMAPR